MGYVDTLSATQRSNIDSIIAEAKKRGLPILNSTADAL